MDNVVYDALTRYYSTLSKLGYYKDSGVFSLLLLCFYRDFVYEDYRGILSKEDYMTIERALNCLFGANCLIPYPDYLKMGKLKLGEMTELAQRVKTLEDTNVVKVMHNAEYDPETCQSDIIFVPEENQ